MDVTATLKTNYRKIAAVFIQATLNAQNACEREEWVSAETKAKNAFVGMNVLSLHLIDAIGLEDFRTFKLEIDNIIIDSI